MTRSTTSGILGGLASALLLAGLTASSAARADVEVAGGTLSGQAEAGGRIVTGNTSSAQFNEYTDFKTGGITNGHVLFEDGDNLFYTSTLWDFTADHDQTYLLDIGQWGLWGFRAEYMNYRQRYSKNSVTPFSGGGGNFLALPPTWNYAAANVDLGAELYSGNNLQPRNLRFNIIEGGADAYVKPTTDLEFSTGYHIQDEHGNKPSSITWGFGSFDSLAQPVDQRTHDVTASMKLAKDIWSAELDYEWSYFDNDLKSFYINNPLQATDSVGAANLGRRTVAPDNQAHLVSLSGAVALPTDYPSRLAGTVSYGIRLQNDNFVPYTSNTALAPGPLPRNDLDGEVQTILGNISYTARPTSDLDFKARYRIYDYDNNSNNITFPVRVPYDNNVVVGDIRSFANSYRKQTVNLDGSYRVVQGLKLKTDFEWENYERSSDREVRHTNEYGGGLGFDLSPLSWVRFETDWGISYRKLNSYQQLDPVELPQLRKYDLANRLRNELNWRTTTQLSDSLSAGISGSFSYDDYDDTRFGLTDGVLWNIGTDLDYSPANWITLGTWYTYDSIEYRQRSMTRTSAANLPSTTPGNIWKSKTLDTAHNVGASLLLTLVPDLVDLQARYNWQKGRAKTNNGGNPTSGVTGDYPAIKYQLHSIESELIFHVADRIDLVGGYAFQRGRYRNFQTDPLGVNLGDNNIYLNNKTDDYAAHIITMTARYEF